MMPAIAGRLAWHRTLLIGLIAFLTLVDLFAAQAILPSLATHYEVSPAEMGTAVNATTFGMAAAALGMALFGQHLPRRRGILVSLMLLSVPTALLAVAPDPASFAVLRVLQAHVSAEPVDHRKPFRRRAAADARGGAGQPGRHRRHGGAARARRARRLRPLTGAAP